MLASINFTTYVSLTVDYRDLSGIDLSTYVSFSDSGLSRLVRMSFHSEADLGERTEGHQTPTAFVRRGDTLKSYKVCHLKAKARIWP